MTDQTTIVVEGWTHDKFIEAIDNAVEQHIREAFRDSLRDKIREDVGTLIAAVSEEVVRHAVLEEIKEGWQETTSWGEARGERKSLKGRVSAILEMRTGDNFNNPDRLSVLERSIRGAIKEHLGKELEQEARAARGKFKAAVDDVIKAKLTESLRGALGL